MAYSDQDDIWDSDKLITAISCLSDEIADGFLQVLKRFGLLVVRPNTLTTGPDRLVLITFFRVLGGMLSGFYCVLIREISKVSCRKPRFNQ